MWLDTGDGGLGEGGVWQNRGTGGIDAARTCTTSPAVLTATLTLSTNTCHRL